LRRVAELIAEKFSGVLGIAVVHRTGDLAIGDLAVVAAVACPHRGEAFDACRELIDVLKASVPIWKHQLFTDGTSEWVGTP
jgi:molybdopterin synthase catalytic subunit